MTKRLIVMAVLAVVLATLTTPVSAQSEGAVAVQGVFDAVNMPIRMGAQNMCDAAEPGSPQYLSWCEGVVVNPRTGRVEGYNPNSVRGQRSRGFRGDDIYRARYENRYRYPSYGYGGYYGSGYGYDGYGVDLNGRTLGTVIGGVAGGVLTRNSRSGLARAGAIIGGAVLGNIVGGKIEDRNHNRYDRPSRGEDPSDCVENVTKDLKKAKVAFSSEQVLAYCSGERGASEAPAPVAPEAAETSDLSEGPQFTPAPPVAPRQMGRPVPQRAPSVYTQGDKLCNDTDDTVAIFVDGVRVGTVLPRSMTSLSRIPKGTINFLPIGK